MNKEFEQFYSSTSIETVDFTKTNPESAWYVDDKINEAYDMWEFMREKQVNPLLKQIQELEQKLTNIQNILTGKS